MTHPVDEADLAAIPTASYFIASIFIGRGQYDKSEQKDLDVARRIAAEMAAHYRNGRGGMVYAVLPNGRSVLVPESYQPKEKEMTEMTDDTYNITNPGPNSLEKKAAKAKGAKKTKVMKVPKVKVAKVAKSPKAPKAPKAAKAPKTNGTTRAPGGARGAILAAARQGKMPAPPDFSANTHKPHRGRLEEVMKLAKAGDVAGLKAFKINPTSTSPKAIDRYRNLAVTALEAKGA